MKEVGGERVEKDEKATNECLVSDERDMLKRVDTNGWRWWGQQDVRGVRCRLACPRPALGALAALRQNRSSPRGFAPKRLRECQDNTEAGDSDDLAAPLLLHCAAVPSETYYMYTRSTHHCAGRAIHHLLVSRCHTAKPCPRVFGWLDTKCLITASWPPTA